MDFKIYLQQRKNSPKSIESHQRNIKQFENWLLSEGLTLSIINQSDILSYLRYCKETGNGNRTLNHKLNSIRKYFNSQEVKSNPCLNLKIKGITKSLPSDLLTENELQNLYETHPEKTLQNQRDKVMLGLLIYQALTTNELMNLGLKDVDQEFGILEIRSGRKSNYRRLKLENHQLESIKSYLINTRPKLERQSGIISQQLLITSGKSTQKEKLKNTIKELMNRLKKQHNYFKNARQLRGSRIALWLEENNLRQVQYMAGHRYISSTERYQMNKVDDLQKALDKYHPRK